VNEEATASEEAALLGAIASGDTEAFGRWVGGAEHALRASLRSFAASVDTESVLQEALLRVWQVAPRFIPDGKPHGLLRLARQIARNLALSECRRHREGVLEPEALERSLEAAALVPRTPDPLLRQALAECRERLPAKPAQALDARLESAGGEADAAIAARLGMRPNTFLQNFTRARKLLAECLEKRGVDLRRELA
jgi:RNA polymerase sigma-70 factor (ECF subfamily)